MQRGFTLIELLVVIAIIGLLSSVLVGSLNTARSKANNAQRVSTVRQYMAAFEGYHASFNRYPVIATAGCLGNSTGTCWDGTYSTATAVNTALASYIPANAVTAPLSPYNGILYFNCPYTGVCTGTGYGMVWFMEGVNTTCGPGQVFQPNGIGQTYCSVIRQY